MARSWWSWLPVGPSYSKGKWRKKWNIRKMFKNKEHCHVKYIVIQGINKPIRHHTAEQNGIRSLVPHLIGPPSHWSPSHWSPNSLVPQYIIGAHWSPISLVPHITGPPSHWSPFSFVTPSSANPNGPPSHWSPISLVPHLIGPPTHQSPISLVPQLAPMHHPFHWSPISLVPHRICPFSPAGPPIHKSPPRCLNSLVPHLIGPPTLPFMPCSHWSPISLVRHCHPLCPVLIGSPISLVPHCHPLYPVLIGPPSHWSPNVTLFTLFSLVPHLIGPPMQPWLYSSHWSPISLVPQSNPVYPVVLIGPPSHCPPPPCNLSYPALIGPPSYWSPNATLVIQFSLVPHLIGPPV